MSREEFDVWGELQRSPPSFVDAGGVSVGRGSKVRLWPRVGGDVLDASLAGRLATVEGIDQDLDDSYRVAVTLDEDPGRDMGLFRQPGHRFFFTLDEIEPVEGRRPPTEILVAGFGDTFKGDSGFGIEVVRRLASRPLPPGTGVVELGIRTSDLAKALHDRYRHLIVVGARTIGDAAGEVWLLDAGEPGSGPMTLEVAGVGSLLVPAGAMGAAPRMWFLGCEPQSLVGAGGRPDQLSERVREAVDPAVAMIERLILQLQESYAGGKKVRNGG